MTGFKDRLGREIELNDIVTYSSGGDRGAVHDLYVIIGETPKKIKGIHISIEDALKSDYERQYIIDERKDQISNSKYFHGFTTIFPHGCIVITDQIRSNRDENTKGSTAVRSSQQGQQ